MIGGYTDVSRPRLDHLQDGIHHTDHGAEGRIVPLPEASDAVEVPEQLVGAVEEMNDHVILRGVGGQRGEV
jgi:hypothetical protein